MATAITPDERAALDHSLRIAERELQTVIENAHRFNPQKTTMLRQLVARAKTTIDEALHEVTALAGDLRVTEQSQRRAQDYIRRKP